MKIQFKAKVQAMHDPDAAPHWKATPHPFYARNWAVSCIDESGRRVHVTEGAGVVKPIRAFDSRAVARAHADSLNAENAPADGRYA